MVLDRSDRVVGDTSRVVGVAILALCERMVEKMSDARPAYTFKCPYCKMGYIDVPFPNDPYSMCGNCGRTVEFEFTVEDGYISSVRVKENKGDDDSRL